MQIAGEFVRKRFGQIEALTVTDKVLIATLVDLFPKYARNGLK